MNEYVYVYKIQEFCIRQNTEVLPPKYLPSIELLLRESLLLREDRKSRTGGFTCFSLYFVHLILLKKSDPMMAYELRK